MDIKYSWDSYQRIADPCTCTYSSIGYNKYSKNEEKGFRFDNCDLYNSYHILCYKLLNTRLDINKKPVLFIVILILDGNSEHV